ncbi:MAG: hypothetical protein ACRDTU_15065 [Micromonosporaceae bacterium]
MVCTLGLCTIPDERAAIHQMHRVLRPGGRLLLLDHVGSAWPPIWGVQWLLEQVTGRAASEYQTRRPLPLLRADGLVIESRSVPRRASWSGSRRLNPPSPGSDDRADSEATAGRGSGCAACRGPVGAG